MTQPAKLDDYAAPCEACNEKRYVLSARGERAVATLCQSCFATCPACGGEEYTYGTDERGYSYVKRCEVCGTLNARVQAFNEARIPARYHGPNATIEHFQTNDPSTGEALGNLSRVKLWIYRWVTGFAPEERGFMLHGPVGTGKTHLLAATVRHLTLEKGIASRFVEFTHLLSEIRSGFDQGRGEAEILGPISEVDVLAIDELGKGRNTDWQLSVIDEIISKRYNRGLTTLFTTNYPVEPPRPKPAESGAYDNALAQETLRERIGERIFSRLHEMSEFLHIVAPDYRKRKG